MHNSAKPETSAATATDLSPYDRAVQRLGLSQTHRYLVDAIRPTSEVLELGPASGYMTALLAERGCVVDAIELNAGDAKRAARFCRTMVVGSVEDEEAFRQLPGCYDVVVMADVLEHLRRPEWTLARVRRLLKADGRVLVSLPNIAYWSVRLQLLRGRFDYTDTGLLDRSHLRFYTRATAIKLCESAGFIIDRFVVPLPERPGVGRLKEWIKRAWPTLLSANFIFILKSDGSAG